MYILWQWLHSIILHSIILCVQLYKQNRYRDTEIKGYVKGVKTSSIYPIRAVMLCMSKVSKEAENALTHLLLITFLIFNRFSIHKKFWKAET